MPPSTPTFYLTARQPLRPLPLLLATLLAAAALAAVLIALGQHHRLHAQADKPGAAPSSTSASSPSDDKDDDPNQIDTVVLGDPSDAPAPAKHGDHVSPVHATILVHLPRFGDQTGLIPDTPAGRALYTWLAAFNHSSRPDLERALPTLAAPEIAATELALRQQTGGYTLLSAREPQPGLLLFRLRDQAPTPAEALGTLQLRPNSSTIATFSLRTLPPSPPPATH